MEIDDMPTELCTPENIIATTLDNGQSAQDVMKSLDRMGFVIVPKEPTAKMLHAGFGTADEDNAWRYRAMIEAAES